MLKTFKDIYIKDKMHCCGKYSEVAVNFKERRKSLRSEFHIMLSVTHGLHSLHSTFQRSLQEAGIQY